MKANQKRRAVTQERQNRSKVLSKSKDSARLLTNQSLCSATKEPKSDVLENAYSSAKKQPASGVKRPNTSLNKMNFGDRLVVTFGKNLTNSQSALYQKGLEKKVTEHIESIYAKYVTDYGSGLARPKFMKPKNEGRRISMRPVYVEFKLGGDPNKEKKVEDEEWVKNLNMFKKQSQEEIQRQMDILEDLDENFENMQKVLDAVDDCQEEFEEIQKEMQYWQDNYGWVLEKDNEAYAAAHAELSKDQIEEMRAEGMKKLQELKQ